MVLSCWLRFRIEEGGGKERKGASERRLKGLGICRSREIGGKWSSDEEVGKQGHQSLLLRFKAQNLDPNSPRIPPLLSDHKYEKRPLRIRLA